MYIYEKRLFMPNVVGVKFKPVTKTYYFLPLDEEALKLHDPVIVLTSRGEELGWISMELKEVPEQDVKGSLKSIVRKATPADLNKTEEHRSLEETALKKCKQKVIEMNLPMKIVEAEYSYDGSKLLFAFSSEQRVDFRELVRYLVRSTHARVEMRQIGARDEAKIIDGYGRCGRQLCCASWLTEFHPVSIRMAKNQQLPLSPTEISGACGRLLCCLAYEDKMYTEMRQELPRNGTVVTTAQGEGKVRGVNILKQSIIVEFENEITTEFPMEEIGIVALPEKTVVQPAKPAKKKKLGKKKNQPEDSTE